MAGRPVRAVLRCPFFDDAHCAPPASADLVQAAENAFDEPSSYTVGSRGAAYNWEFSSIKHMGAGQFYLMAICDSHGEPLDGNRPYQLIVPAGAPVSLYWAATAYDRATHALIRDVPRASRSSTSPGLYTNDYGSVRLDIGPTPPDGNDSYWLLTHRDPNFEVLFGFYGPGKPCSTRPGYCQISNPPGKPTHQSSGRGREQATEARPAAADPSPAGKSGRPDPLCLSDRRRILASGRRVETQCHLA